jgi:hypothetical protein
MSFLLLVGTRDVRTQSARAQPAHARLMFLPGFGCTYESVGARFLSPKKKKKKLVLGQARKPNTEECKLKIGGQVGS